MTPREQKAARGRKSRAQRARRPFAAGRPADTRGTPPGRGAGGAATDRRDEDGTLPGEGAGKGPSPGNPDGTRPHAPHSGRSPGDDAPAGPPQAGFSWAPTGI